MNRTFLFMCALFAGAGTTRPQSLRSEPRTGDASALVDIFEAILALDGQRPLSSSNAHYYPRICNFFLGPRDGHWRSVGPFPCSPQEK